MKGVMTELMFCGFSYVRTPSCTTQSINLAENAGFQFVINNFKNNCDIDAGKMGVQLCGGLGPTYTWLKYCGTAGKTGSKWRR